MGGHGGHWLGGYGMVMQMDLATRQALPDYGRRVS